jgi:hypothetical protein
VTRSQKLFFSLTAAFLLGLLSSGTLLADSKDCFVAPNTVAAPTTGTGSSEQIEATGFVLSLYFNSSGGASGTFHLECSNVRDGSYIACSPTYTFSDAVPRSLSIARADWVRVNLDTNTAGVAGPCYFTRYRP